MRTEDANRERLVQFLRDEDAQREQRFAWDFTTVMRKNACGSSGCAIGAGLVLGLIKRAHTSDAERDDFADAVNLCAAIGLPRRDADIFLHKGVYPAVMMSSVTAAMVADKIEEVAREGYGG